MAPVPPGRRALRGRDDRGVAARHRGSQDSPADDDQSLVRTLSWILKHEGYEVVVAPGGEGLLSKLEEERPHLLLLDIMMPQVDGLQLLQKIKADERFRHLPV